MFINRESEDRVTDATLIKTKKTLMEVPLDLSLPLYGAVKHISEGKGLTEKRG